MQMYLKDINIVYIAANYSTYFNLYVIANG